MNFIDELYEILSKFIFVLEGPTDLTAHYSCLRFIAMYKIHPDLYTFIHYELCWMDSQGLIALIDKFSYENIPWDDQICYESLCFCMLLCLFWFVCYDEFKVNFKTSLSQHSIDMFISDFVAIRSFCPETWQIKYLTLKVKVLAKVKTNGHIWGLKLNWNVCFSFRGNLIIFSRDMANSIFDLESQGLGQGQNQWPHLRPRVELKCLLFISRQSDNFFERYGKFNIWPWKITVKVMAKID